jgi:Holliday junction resolvase RusA-like endonuclease
MTISFTVLGVPSPKQAIKTRIVRVGAQVFAKHYKSEKTRDAENTFVARSLKFRPDMPLAGPLRLELVFVLPMPKHWSKKLRARAETSEVPHVVRPDLDNCIKLVKDAMSGVFWIDDKSVCSVAARKIYGAFPRTEVRIEELVIEERKAS